MDDAHIEPDQRVEGVIPIYSVAKVFTAAAALLLFDEDTAIGTLTAVPARLAQLRLRDLLAHRSGLDDYGTWPDYQQAVAAREAAWPPEEILDRVKLGTPGPFRYSNPGYLLVRRALEDAQAQPFFAVLDRHVLAPLGIEAFAFATHSDWDRCAPSAVPDVRAYDPGWVYPGTIAARAAHVAAGLARLMAGELGAQLPRQMRRTQPLDAPDHPGSDPGYGLGLMTDGQPVAIVGHGGGGPGFTLYVAATVDGSHAHNEAVASEIDARPLIATCLAALSVP